ncbi:hypothetical protein HYALB_00013705 [Hymenoscyphus albidus]|uniref:Uncharacterized protein n=1 Tax=Hymenoscyphus albidus TaxID=595503 RepID=A0A9N9LWK3_9HELO|nr:hypothetical protein HYALB_00013705 [Hymenoscyphus albidus]
METALGIAGLVVGLLALLTFFELVWNFVDGGTAYRPERTRSWSFASSRRVLANEMESAVISRDSGESPHATMDKIIAKNRTAIRATMEKYQSPESVRRDSRLLRETRNAYQETSGFVTWSPLGNTLHEIVAAIRGPPESPYSDGIFYLRLSFPSDISVLMEKPEPEDPVRLDVCAQFINDRAAFERMARELTDRYATGELGLPGIRQDGY